MEDSRILSLIASSTEIVCALGLKSQLVGRSHECDYPLDIKQLPQCTSPKFKTDGTSLEIDERIRSIVSEGLSVYRVDPQMLEKLQPTHIITQDQCEVCAVSLKDVESAVCQLVSSNPQIVSLHPNCLEDLYRDIDKVAVSLNVGDRGQDLVSSMQNRFQTIQEKLTGIKVRPSMVCIEWIEPLMSAGNWMPELVDIAGGTMLFGTAGKHSPMLSWESVLENDPDFIFVCPCGFDIERTKTEMGLLTKLPRWSELKAVRNGKVFIGDGNQYFQRPGPRLVESAEILSEIMHPEFFSFGHENSGWILYS